MKWIIQKTGKYLGAVLLLCAFTVILTFAGVVQALAMRNFLDYAAAGDRSGFLYWFAVFFGLIFFQLVGGVVRNLLHQRVSTSLYNRFTADSFHTVLTRQYASLRGRHSGELMQLIASDTGVVTDHIIGIPMQICSILTQLIAASWCLAVLQGKLALLLLGCFLLMLLVGLPLKRFVRKYHKQVMDAQGRVRSVLQEALDNMLILRAFQAVKGTEQQAKTRMGEYRSIIMRKALFSQIMGSGGATAINIAYIIGMLWCGLGIVNGSVSFGTFSAVWQLIGQITGPAMQVTGILPQYYTMTASAERLQELENLPPEKTDANNDWQKIRESFDAVCCENLTFSYDGTEQNAVLRNLDFTIHKGDFIAITGTSGIGKSTLLKLLLGIYTPEKKCIHVTCTDGRDAVLDAGVRSMISYVPQGNFLMSGTIREAIHFWQGEHLDEARIRQACRIAEAEDFILGLEQGYDTHLGERGAGLSEGQLQRLAIARAIYSEKPVLLLDEATSALDEQTEAKVLQNLQQLHNRTVIIVTHRKAALDICNRVVEMEDGRVREHHDK